MMAAMATLLVQWGDVPFEEALVMTGFGFVVARFGTVDDLLDQIVAQDVTRVRAAHLFPTLLASERIFVQACTVACQPSEQFGRHHVALGFVVERVGEIVQRVRRQIRIHQCTEEQRHINFPRKQQPMQGLDELDVGILTFGQSEFAGDVAAVGTHIGISVTLQPRLKRLHRCEPRR